MNTRLNRVLPLLLAACCGPFTVAAEIQLQGQCQPRGNLVLLGDVAQIVAGSDEQAAALGRVELFPAPPAGAERYLRLREIQDVLALRGVNLAEHTFSGSSQVTVSVDSDVTPAPRPEKSPLTGEKQRAVRTLQSLVLKEIERVSSAKQPWQVEIVLDDEQVRRINSAQRVTLSGGARPKVGKQDLVAKLESFDGPAEMPFEAEIGLPQTIVVANRSLPRGAIVQASDVRLEHDPTPGGSAKSVRNLDEVIGKETAQALAVGRVVEPEAIRSPLLVRRGEVVTVYSRAGGVTIRTTARARDNGADGQSIEVESLLNRKTITVRVCGLQEVELMANASGSAGGTPR